MIARSSESENQQRSRREQIAEELKKALEDLEKEHKRKEDWEKEARKKHSEHVLLKKEVEQLNKSVEALKREGAEKDEQLNKAEEQFLEVEAERGVLEKLKLDLEWKLAEVKTHHEKGAHDFKKENESLKTRLARAIELSGDEFDEVVGEIEKLREDVVTLSDEKEALKSQVHAVKEKLADSGEENSTLRENISEILQSNIELIQQNEALKGKVLSVESAFEETLAEQQIAQDKAELTGLDKLFVDGGLDGDVVDSGMEKISTLKEEIASLKDYVEQLKQENDNLCNNLEDKVENELELRNKVSELENEMYKSANEMFEMDKDDVQRFVKEKKSAEVKLKKLTSENRRLVEQIDANNEEITSLQVRFVYD